MAGHTEIISSCGNRYRTIECGGRWMWLNYIVPGVRNPDIKLHECYNVRDDSFVGYIATVNSVSGPVCMTGGFADLDAKRNAIMRAINVYVAHDKTK